MIPASRVPSQFNNYNNNCHKNCFSTLKFASLPFQSCFLPVCLKKTNKSKMTKKNSPSCQYALIKFKIAELSLKNKLDLLQLAIDQQKSFRLLTQLINNAKANIDELKTTLVAGFKESLDSSSISSFMERYSNLLSRL